MGKQNRRAMGLGSKIIIMICLIIFIGCGGYIANYLYTNFHASNQLKNIKDDLPEGKQLLALYEKNHDIFGWVEIPGTNVDYPVMNSDVDDDEFYLHRDFNGEYSVSGTPFKDAYSDITSSNWLIYGHNMKMGTMFHDLLKYDSQKFWKKHKYFTFDHLEVNKKTGKLEEVDQRCVVVAGCYSKLYPEGSDAFQYYDYVDIEDEELFTEYVNGVLSQSSIDTGVKPKYGDQLITLSTCAYHTENGRFYLVGKILE